ncbi:hypothetical protein PHLGIDRAFT_337401 [Phlebiopsis gigantea 11061_1 CR5-6]|uniref:Uncharacterized protein n=1 Tax=Phlebiopsis gigantea (strain 11061_1 CR5-6) TaxID=745531 RepID=A0A0C3PA90_PHLG1|nr:hypothetical protein PHLGIDRAFT_337401 [Phlebiopsis gigantea 11061_1 CR5-6]
MWAAWLPSLRLTSDSAPFPRLRGNASPARGISASNRLPDGGLRIRVVSVRTGRMSGSEGAPAVLDVADISTAAPHREGSREHKTGGQRRRQVFWPQDVCSVDGAFAQGRDDSAAGLSSPAGCLAWVRSISQQCIPHIIAQGCPSLGTAQIAMFKDRQGSSCSTAPIQGLLRCTHRRIRRVRGTSPYGRRQGGREQGARVRAARDPDAVVTLAVCPNGGDVPRPLWAPVGRGCEPWVSTRPSALWRHKV